MGKYDKRVDFYINKSSDFAKPILTHIRELIHKSSDKIEETIKWGFPHFDYKGTVCSMASFNKHCAFGFWKAKLLKDKYQLLQIQDREAMGSLGRITKIKDLPEDKIFVEYIKEAIKLNDEGVKIPKVPKPAAKKELIIPDYFIEFIGKNKKALKTFKDFSYSHKKEYVKWVDEAKTEPTKLKRLETTLEWLKEGKTRNWKYAKC